MEAIKGHVVIYNEKPLQHIEGVEIGPYGCLGFRVRGKKRLIELASTHLDSNNFCAPGYHWYEKYLDILPPKELNFICNNKK